MIKQTFMNKLVFFCQLNLTTCTGLFDIAGHICTPFKNNNNKCILIQCFSSFGHRVYQSTLFMHDLHKLNSKQNSQILTATTKKLSKDKLRCLIQVKPRKLDFRYYKRKNGI